MADGIFSIAPYQSLSDPQERLLGYVDFRKAILQGELPDYTCLLGTMVQEAYDTHPLIRKASDRCIGAHAAILVPDIEAAIRKYLVKADWTMESLAYYTQAVIQGACLRLWRPRESRCGRTFASSTSHRSEQDFGGSDDHTHTDSDCLAFCSSRRAAFPNRKWPVSRTKKAEKEIHHVNHTTAKSVFASARR